MISFTEEEEEKIYSTLEKVLRKYATIEDNNDIITSELIRKIVRKPQDKYNMPSFLQAFVHSSAEMTKNYEKPEFYGDAILKVGISRYLLAYEGNTELSFYTPMVGRMGSNEVNAIVSIALGLTKLPIKHKACIGSSVYSDVYEAFLGILALRCEVATKGSSYLVCNRFVENVILNIMDNQTKAPKKDDITFVGQILRGKDGIDITNVLVGTKYVSTIKLTQKGKEILAEYGTPQSRLLDDELGRAEDKDKTKAAHKAASIARQKLADVGIDDMWYREYAYKKLHNQYKNDENYALIKELATASGLDYINLQQPEKWQAEEGKYGLKSYLLSGAKRNKEGGFDEHQLFIGTIDVKEGSKKIDNDKLILKMFADERRQLGKINPKSKRRGPRESSTTVTRRRR